VKTRNRFDRTIRGLLGLLLGIIFALSLTDILTVIGPQPGGYLNIIFNPEEHGFVASSHPIFYVTRFVLLQAWPIFLGISLVFAVPFNNKQRNHFVLAWNASLCVAFVLCFGVLFILYLFGVNVGRLGEILAVLIILLAGVVSIWNKRVDF